MSPRRLRLVSVEGSATRSFRLTITLFRSLFICTVRGSTFLPSDTAWFRSGSAARRSRTPGCSRREKSANSARNGCCTGSERRPASSAGGPFEIVSRRACGSDEIAPKAIAPFVNCSALSTATGATMRAASASSGKKRTSCVVGSARAAETGLRFANSGLRAVIASFREAPRAAKALPKPIRTRRLFSRVAVSNVL